MSEKQYFRNIDAGDSSLEGRSSNGITAKTDGAVLVYTGVKQNISEQSSTGDNIDINGTNSTVMAIIPADKTLEFPEGNNNKETVQPASDNNKLTKVKVKTKFDSEKIANMGKVDETIPLHLSALLDLTSYTEGTAGSGQNGYDVMFGFYIIKGWTPDTTQKHPNICRPFGSKGKCSTAAGRYQFLYGTWVGLMGANTPFNKKNQDLGGVKLALERTTDKIALEAYNIALTGVTNVNDNEPFLKILGSGKKNFAGGWASIPDRNGVYQYDEQNGKYTPQTVYDLYLTILQAYKKFPQQVPVPLQTTQQVPIIPPVESLPTIEQSEPQASPVEEETTSEEDFMFLSETGVELKPVEIIKGGRDGSEVLSSSDETLLKEIENDLKNNPESVEKLKKDVKKILENNGTN
jgi:muramidase (phage lysozyme)